MNRKLLNRINKNKMYIPNWMDPKLKLHYRIWDAMCNCNNIILYKVLVEKILTQDDLDNIFLEFEDEINRCFGFGYDLEVIVYYEVFTKYLMKELLDWEEYEEAANLKKMLEQYFNIKIQNWYE